MNVRSEIPIMLLQLIETLVKHRSHEDSIHRFAVFLYRKSPFFLLSGGKKIAEGGPLKVEFLVRQWSLYFCGMGIAFAILNPSETHHDTIAVGFLVGYLTIQELVSSVYGTSLDEIIA